MMRLVHVLLVLYAFLCILGAIALLQQAQSRWFFLLVVCLLVNFLVIISVTVFERRQDQLFIRVMI